MDKLHRGAVDMQKRWFLEKQTERVIEANAEFVNASPPTKGMEVKALSAKGKWWDALITRVYRTGDVDVSVHDGCDTKWRRQSPLCIWCEVKE